MHEQRQDPLPPRASSKWRKELREWSLTLGAALIISFLVQNYAFAQVKVEQHSMDSTLAEGQRLVENRLVYRFTEPSRGDIVIVKGPETPKRLVKRVIGLPGEILDMKDGAVYINGTKLDEAYVKGATFPAEIQMPYTVPESTYFVMGDNRENSMDSRSIGAVAKSSVEGKAFVRLYPLNRIHWFN